LQIADLLFLHCHSGVSQLAWHFEENSDCSRTIGARFTGISLNSAWQGAHLDISQLLSVRADSSSLRSSE
jgi:hypothetical protein